MSRKWNWVVVLGSLIAGMFASQAFAGPTWQNFIPFEPRVEYDAKKAYAIHQGNGPWMILAASFTGEKGLGQARELLKELRTRFNVQAYIHRRDFDYNERMAGKGYAKESRDPVRMKYYKDGVSEQYVVLVGNFSSVDDPGVARTLEKLKYAKPKSLEITKTGTSQNLAFIRYLQRSISADQDKRNRGPMANAFVTRNPLLPQEYFNPQGVDSFVYSLNKDVQFSLLKNKGRFTVKVASFRGKTTMSARPTENAFQPTNKLELAADQAHRLTEALRRKGVEAYEFHDRHESIVTVGSFEKVGEPRLDGKTEIHPGIHQIMQQYGPQKQQLRSGQLGLMPRTLAGIPFDLQPMPIVVPRMSIANDYNRAGQLGFLR